MRRDLKASQEDVLVAKCIRADQAAICRADHEGEAVVERPMRPQLGVITTGLA